MVIKLKKIIKNMMNEKKKIMNAKLKVNEFQISEKPDNFSNSLNILYTDILNKISNNIIWVFLSISFQYLFLISFTFDNSVSFYYIHI